MNKQYNVVISGIQGYVGQALMTLIYHHPSLHLKAVHARQGKDEIYQLMPQLAKQSVPIYSLADIKAGADSIDILLLATPANASMEIVSELINCGIKMIDLSGAFRLAENEFSEWYGLPHSAPQLIKNASYGLSPWATGQSHAQLIANPGCYATCALMSLLPLLKAKVIQSNNIIIDAKSGVSGSGKQIKPELMFCELSGNFFPYKIGKHQHIPEIKNALFDLSGQTANIRLTTSILPIVRGISMTIYLDAREDLHTDTEISKAIKDAYQDAYKDYPLIQIDEIGQGATNADQFILSLKNVVHTPNTHIGYFIKDRQITLFSSIDNLLKGAASQAIENINAIYHLPIQTGLFPVTEES